MDISLEIFHFSHYFTFSQYFSTYKFYIRQYYLLHINSCTFICKQVKRRVSKSFKMCIAQCSGINKKGRKNCAYIIYCYNVRDLAYSYIQNVQLLFCSEISYFLLKCNISPLMIFIEFLNYPFAITIYKINSFFSLYSKI